MEVTQTLAEGLKREFKVVLAAAELEVRLNTGLEGIKGRVNINGFRPGKAPMSFLRKMYGRSVMSDVLQNAVNEANQKIANDNAVRFAMEPQVRFPESKEEVEAALEAKGDLAFTVAVEVLPKFELQDHADVELSRMVAEPSDADVTSALERMAQQNRSFDPKADGAKAEDGDKLVISFVGRIGGELFEGGSAENIDLVLGSNSFIPGFEPQMLGAAVGDTRTVNVQFPPNYMSETLAGKDASFEVTVNAIQAPGELKIDNELAKAFGMEDLAKLKDAVKAQLQREIDAQSRRKLKKSLLDALDARYAFDLPSTLVEQEFAGVWSQVENDMKNANKTFADEGTTEEEAKADYRKIAERRVRLGLVLAEIGEGAKVQVSDDEVTKALIERARQYPGQEKQVWEFYRKNPQALAELRAPIFEEKVVDHLLEKARVNDLKVDRETLFRDDDAEPAAEAAGDEKPKAKAKAKKKVD